jgi:hypothetical protein
MMLPAPVLTFLAGSAVKIVVGWLQAKIAMENQQQRYNNAEQAMRLEAQTRLVMDNAKDPFVQDTRRQLFQLLTLGFLWVIFFFMMDSSVDWLVYSAEESGRNLSLWQRLLTGTKGKFVHIAVIIVGMLAELMPAIIGFFVTPSPKK